MNPEKTSIPKLSLNIGKKKFEWGGIDLLL